MISALSRRLRIRDDGTGKSADNECTFLDFEAENAIVLLGDPGMGKTTLFNEAAQGYCITVRNFLVNPKCTTREPIYLDALDEYRAIESGKDASAEVARVLCSLKRPKFRLSCRAADWYGSIDQNVLRQASESSRVVVLELLPLSRDEILNILKEKAPKISDPFSFLEEVAAAGLEKLLGNPQTLELMARAWETDPKPRNKFEAYNKGITELLKEINEAHSICDLSNYEPVDLRKAAGAVFSVLLLSGSVGISRSESLCNNGYIHFTTGPYQDKIAIKEVLKRRLFSSSSSNSFLPVHRTIAEFLAAEDLSTRINNGLSINRVLSLICGNDGKPISSLRGLFAWLMCNLGPSAEDYIERDPYGITTYGDVGVLLPQAQCAILSGLQKLKDPWFLTNEDDRGSFCNLANKYTANIIKNILEESETSFHLKIFVLEAIANSSEAVGLETLIKAIVIDKQNDTWLRTTALKAYVKSVNNDWKILEALDFELHQALDDFSAPKVRADLLQLTKEYGILALRLLSIMEQAAHNEKERLIIGSFYMLIDLPSDDDITVILDGSARVLIPKNKNYSEFIFLFDKWLMRRLKSSIQIIPKQLSMWLFYLRIGRYHYSKDTISLIKELFIGTPLLFEKVFLLLTNIANKGEYSFWHFLFHDLREILPDAIWPVPKCEFYLYISEKEIDPEKASYYFRMYLSCFPTNNASIELANNGLAFISRRPDVELFLKNWKICEIEEWRLEDYNRRNKMEMDYIQTRNNNIAYISPRLLSIREGAEEHVLYWATKVYSGLDGFNKDISDPQDRLVYWTNDEIADAIIQGIPRYIEINSLPNKEELIKSYCDNKTPIKHVLLNLSIFMRLEKGMGIPTDNLHLYLASVITSIYFTNCTNINEKLNEWLLIQLRENSNIVKTVLKEIWIQSINTGKYSLPKYDELNNQHYIGFLSSLSAEVLKSIHIKDHNIINKLATVLLKKDPLAAIENGELYLSKKRLSTKIRTIWITVLYLIEPIKYLNLWKNLKSLSNDTLWDVMKIINASETMNVSQRAQVVELIGRRFQNVGHPSHAWFGDHNPWDASEFVSKQIKLIATDTSIETDAQLERLENDKKLASYHDLIKHNRAQHEKRKREEAFTFASPEEIAEALQNKAPATPNDLLSYVIDQLIDISNHLLGSATEKYRAFWNEQDRSLDKPKREEICSGILTDELNSRIKTHGLNAIPEYHMIHDKECDIVVLQGTERIIPIEVKHHYNHDLWKACKTQLDDLYTSDLKTNGLGIYLILWSGIAKGRAIPKPPGEIERPSNKNELKIALESLIPEKDKHRLVVVIIDISGTYKAQLQGA